MAEIFISYKSERRNAARHLAKILRCYGYDVWYDYGLIPGDDFEPRLIQELESASAVIVLWCNMASKSEWVRKEAAYARSTKTYLPCWIEETTLPCEFAGADTIDLKTWDGAPRSHALDPMLADIARRLGRSPNADFASLREIDEDWRTFGAPTLAQFALGQPPLAMKEATSPRFKRVSRPESARFPPDAVRRLLGQRPRLLDEHACHQWDAALEGSSEALLSIARCYRSGLGGFTEDERKAERLLKFAAERGNASAQLSLGQMYLDQEEGLFSGNNRAEGIRLITLAADGGYDYAQYHLARLYESGRYLYLRQDNPLALEWYKTSARNGNPSSQFRLNEIYRSGELGVTKDEMLANSWLIEAANNQHQEAMLRLALAYESADLGLQKDHIEALRLLREAASDPLLGLEAGLEDAQYELAVIYRTGRLGVAISNQEADRLMRIAAESGHSAAQADLKQRGQNW